MLTVYSVLWGDKYSKDYVYTHQAMVSRHLTVPHEYVCITDHDLPGIKTLAPVVGWHGWWQKVSLFAVADGPSIYLDLDVVIVGSLDYLAEFAETSYPLAAAKNWGQSGHGGIQSSVMAWNGLYREPVEKFDYPVDSKRLWGDQEYLTELLRDNFSPLAGICSYKYHCRPTGKPPADASVVCFHGKPDPHEVSEEWVKQSRSIQI